MAERRMFAKTIVLSDAFLDMPMSARCLYFTLGMLADDDGFINSPKAIMRQCGASLDDMNLLLAKKFLIAFDDGVVVIKHWRIHNYIQTDRYIPTKYKEQKALLELDENKAYKVMYTECIQNVSKVDTQDRLGKDRLGKDSVEEKEAQKRFTPPTISEVSAYCKDKGYSINAERFVDFYQSKGWMVGKTKMKDWKAAVRGWASRDKADARSNAPADSAWISDAVEQYKRREKQ